MASSIPVSAPADVVLRHRRPPWLAIAGIAFVIGLFAMAAAAPLISPYDPVRQSLRMRLKPPTLEGADGFAHPLGTDHLGRDVLSRVIYGSRVSLLIGFAAVGVGSLVGATLGIVAGYRRGTLDTVIMTLADA